MKKLLLLCLFSFVGCSVQQAPDPTVVTVNKKDLLELTYEWAMYKEIAIIAYAKIHGCSKEDAAAHLDNSIKYSEAKQFIADVEFNQKWEKK